MPVLRNIAQLATCPPGNAQEDAGLINNAAIAWQGEKIEWVGPDRDVPSRFSREPVTDCERRIVIPGLIDCHTHLCFGGWRADEFALRIGGASYQEIAAAGGGISSTVTATRASSLGELRRKAGRTLDAMLKLGVTTVECKSGYGLDMANELKLLEVYRLLDQSHPIDLVPTFLGAHAIPAEYRNNREKYIHLLCEELIPAVSREGLAKFCDAFVENGAFTINEARKILTTAAEYGMKTKIHADQLSDSGGAALAAELGAVSAEHLEYVSHDGIAALAQAGTVAVSLPLASFYLGEPYLPARDLLCAGVPVAVATDFNPGSAPSFHLPLAMTMACIHQRMTPQEVLNGATTVAARAVSAADRIGSLIPGYNSDLAIIDSPSLNQWLYHFVPNACIRVLKNGSWV
jgi:imidazolonepropionase